MLTHVFNDKRLTSLLLVVWILMTYGFFDAIGIVESEFVTIGPSDHTKFMGTTLDTWNKWGYVAVFTFANSIVHEFVVDSIDPWIQNTVQDHKSKVSPGTVHVIFWILSSVFDTWCMSRYCRIASGRHRSYSWYAQSTCMSQSCLLSSSP